MTAPRFACRYIHGQAVPRLLDHDARPTHLPLVAADFTDEDSVTALGFEVGSPIEFDDWQSSRPRPTRGHSRCDGYALENEWRTWAAKKPAPGNADGAFIAFCKSYAKRHPL